MFGEVGEKTEEVFFEGWVEVRDVVRASTEGGVYLPANAVQKLSRVGGGSRLTEKTDDDDVADVATEPRVYLLPRTTAYRRHSRVSRTHLLPAETGYIRDYP